MSEELSQILAAMNRRFDQVDERLVRVDEGLGPIDERLGRMDEHLDRMDERIGRVEEQLTHVRVELMARLDRQQDVLAGIRDDIRVNVAATDTVRERHNAIRNDYDQLAHQVSVIHRRLIQLEQRVDRGEGGA